MYRCNVSAYSCSVVPIRYAILRLTHTLSITRRAHTTHTHTHTHVSGHTTPLDAISSTRYAPLGTRASKLLSYRRRRVLASSNSRAILRATRLVSARGRVRRGQDWTTTPAPPKATRSPLEALQVVPRRGRILWIFSPEGEREQEK